MNRALPNILFFLAMSIFWGIFALSGCGERSSTGSAGIALPIPGEIPVTIIGSVNDQPALQGAPERLRAPMAGYMVKAVNAVTGQTLPGAETITDANGNFVLNFRISITIDQAIILVAWDPNDTTGVTTIRTILPSDAIEIQTLINQGTATITVGAVSPSTEKAVKDVEAALGLAQGDLGSIAVPANLNHTKIIKEAKKGDRFVLIGAALNVAGQVTDAGKPLTPVATGRPVPGGTLNPLSIPKYASPLVIPPEMPPASVNADGSKKYDIEVIPHLQQILPPFDNDGNPLSATPVWTYGSTGLTQTRNYPAFTIEVTKDKNAEVIWRNNLVDDTGAFLPHLLPVDRSLHWANPELLFCMDGTIRTDCRPDPLGSLILDQPYTGPVPIITHVHGAHTGPESDGYPETWYLPNANNIPDGFAATGRLANQFGVSNTLNGAATFNYPNDQASTTLWYHDHTLGMTRLNVYAGPAGFWLIREADGGETGLAPNDALGNLLSLPAPRPDVNTDPFDHLNAGTIREIPVVIQDRSFNVDAAGNTSLFYPDNRAFFEGLPQAHQLEIPFIGDPLLPSDIPAIWNPEAFFNVMVVNGVSWPFLKVEPERYRFRLLNGSNSRFLNLSLQALDARGKALGEVPFYQIGADQGLLPKVVRIVTGEQIQLPGNGTEPPLPTTFPAPGTEAALLMGLAERADVIVDFSKLPPGTTRVRMLNTAPDAPFGGFPDIPADPGTTGQVMEFVLVNDNQATVDNSTQPRDLVLPAANLVTPDATRSLALLEEESSLVCVSVNPAGKIKYIDLEGFDFDPLDPDSACALAGGVPFAPKAAVLGNVTIIDGLTGTGEAGVQLWGDLIQHTPTLNTTETWELWNFSEDAHPIHLHLVKFKVVNREVLDIDPDNPRRGTPSGVISGPNPGEEGFKDTVIAMPGEITRVQATFDIAGLYVWHCHIVEHEDNEMMVPYCVEDPAGGTFCGPQAPIEP